MITIKRKSQKEKIRKFFVDFKNKQKLMEDDMTLIYTMIPLELAIKYNLLITDFLLHPKLVKKRKFYEPIDSIIEKANMIETVKSILEFELSQEINNTYMSTQSTKDLIKSYNKLIGVKKNATTKTASE